MAVRLRLTRIGATKRPSYRVVAIEKQRARDGRALEILGFYDPLTDPATVKLDADRIQAWISKGAQPSDTVVKLMRLADNPPRPKAEKAKPAARARKAKPTAAAASEPATEEPAEAAPEQADATAEEPQQAAPAPTEAAAEAAGQPDAPAVEADGEVEAEAEAKA